MDISNSLYYTFSTISQVLAAFIALSGVFVIFKNQELKKAQFIQVQHFYSYLNGINGLFIGSFHGCANIAVTLQTLHKSESLGGMETEMDRILKNEHVINSPESKGLNRMKTTFDNINRKRLQVLKYTNISIVSGVLTIIFSLSILPFVPQIMYNNSLILLCIGFSGLLISMTSMLKVISISLKDQNFLTDK